MLSCDINHPEIESFITAKSDLTKVTGANISVKVTDGFMQIVSNPEEYYFNILGREDPNKLWKKLIYQAWKAAEPGVLFWDRIKSESIPSCYGKDWEETSTNPCKNYYKLVV